MSMVLNLTTTTLNSHLGIACILNNSQIYCLIVTMIGFIPTKISKRFIWDFVKYRKQNNTSGTRYCLTYIRTYVKDVKLNEDDHTKMQRLISE